MSGKPNKQVAPLTPAAPQPTAVPGSGYHFSDFRQLVRSPLIWLSLVAALLYSSWPLGFWLDPSVERHQLASQLEAPGHPYNWVFVLLDVLTGLVLAGVGIWQLLRHRAHSWTSKAIIISYVSFGVLVAVAALTPLLCDPTTQSCGPLVHNYHVLVHGIASIASVIFLLGALLGVTINAYRRGGANWLFVGLTVLLIAWLAFGIGSLGSLFWHGFQGNQLQDYFITICSLTIVAVVVVYEFHAPLQN